MELNYSVSPVKHGGGQRSTSWISLNEATFWNSVVTQVYILRIVKMLFLNNYVHLVLSGKEELDCFGTLECQDEKDNGVDQDDYNSYAYL